MKLLESLPRWDVCCNDRKQNVEIDLVCAQSPVPPVGIDLVNATGDFNTRPSESLTDDVAKTATDLGVSHTDFLSGGFYTSSTESPRLPLQRTSSPRSSNLQRYDIFLSHLQRNGQDAIISMQVFLQQARPGIKIFIDLDVDMKGDLTGTLEEGVRNCGAFLFFITDGILNSEWCARELRWAVHYDKRIILVRETDDRHGGLDMSVFLKQVPEEFMDVFKNTIAIPWYRQPAFRNVSIQSILKAADLQDELAEHLQRLQHSKEASQVVFVSEDKDDVNCFELIAAESWAMRVVFFVGGFSCFKRKRVEAIYTIIFTMSFWACGVLCTANLVYKSVPYHVLATGALTAYVHLPAWQSWFTWRRFVKSTACDDLLTKVMANDANKKRIARSCRVMGWLVLVLQLAMVLFALAGFALPRVMGQGDAAREEWESTELFTDLHSSIMWVVLPPMVGAMFASYSMFGFLAGLHWLDIRSVQGTLQECVSILGSFYCASTPCEAVGLESMGADSEAVFQTACDLLVMVFRQTQDRIDNSCMHLGGLWLHLVFFSTCEVLVISQAFGLHAHAHAHDHVHMHYEWWWGFQDFFHLVGGILLLAAAMGVFCVITSSFNFVLVDTLELLGRSGCPAPRQASVMSLLASRPLGMNIMRKSIYIDASKAGLFFFIVLTILINNCIKAVNGLDE